MKFTCLCAAAACCMGLAPSAGAQQRSSQPTSTDKPAVRPATPLSDLEPIVPGLAASEDEAPGTLKSLLSRINSNADGLTPRVGSIVSGGGLALGAHYRHGFANRNLFFDVEHLGSFKGYQATSFGFSSRPLFSGRVTVGVGLERASLPQEDFYGLGPDSDEASHTSYNRTGVETNGWMSYRPSSSVEIRTTLGFINTQLSAGRQDGVPSIDQRFTDATAEGVSRESDFLHAGVTMSLDRRDSIRYTRSGSYYEVGLQHFVGLGQGETAFFRLDLDARRYVPVRGLTENDSIAIRGRLSVTNVTESDSVPFYFLPRLGGSALRGYDSSRFVDQQAAVVNLEYRWQLRRRLQIVGFADAGQVAPSFGSFSASRFQTSFGAGVRYRGFRLDYAVGREGSRFHLGFGPTF